MRLSVEAGEVYRQYLTWQAGQRALRSSLRMISMDGGATQRPLCLGGQMSLSYEEALDYLYSLINYEVQRPNRYTPDVVSLDRPRALMAAFGDPQETYPIIHV